MTPARKRAMKFLWHWPKRKFGTFCEAARHREGTKRPLVMNVFRRLSLSPASPHSKVYGH